jgi:hypothetical protein
MNRPISNNSGVIRSKTAVPTKKLETTPATGDVPGRAGPTGS